MRSATSLSESNAVAVIAVWSACVLAVRSRVPVSSSPTNPTPVHSTKPYIQNGIKSVVGFQLAAVLPILLQSLYQTLFSE